MAASSVMQAHPRMPSRLRSWIENVLPWWDPRVERLRNARTEAIRRSSMSERIRAERVIAEYEAADRATGDAHGKAEKKR